MTVSNQERERVREFYESQAQENPRHAAVLGEPNDFAAAYREHQELAVFREIVPLQSSTRFIEFGSGGGRWLEAVAATVRECAGVEFSNRCVEISRQRLADFDNVSIHRSDIQDFDLESEFDVLYYAGVLLYLTDQELDRCLSKHLPHLTSDGYVLIRDSVSLTKTHPYPRKQGYQTIYRSIETWQQILESHDLKLITRVPANGRPISDRVRRSKTLQLIHRVSRQSGYESVLMYVVSRTLGHISNASDLDPGYSHDFMLCQRAAR
jgi:SAM-dependent methyltransferase